MDAKVKNSQLKRLVGMVQNERNYREKQGQLERAELCTGAIKYLAGLMVDEPKAKKK